MKTQNQKLTTEIQFSTDENTMFLTAHGKVICKFQFVKNPLVYCAKCVFSGICKQNSELKCSQTTRQDETNGYWKTIE